MTGDDLRDLFADAMYQKSYNALERDSQVALVDTAHDALQDAVRSSAGLCGVLGLLGLNTREGVMYDAANLDGEGYWTMSIFGPPRSEPSGPRVWVVLPSGPATKEDEPC